MNNYNNELLTILAEECAEVIVECSKIIRFGPESVYEGVTAREKLEKEIGDLMCLIDLAQKADLVSFTSIDEHSQKKLEKLKKWSNIV